VFCWDDLWRLVRESAKDGPAWLSKSATGVVLDEAIRRVRDRDQDHSAILDDAFGRAGYRRQLATRIENWTTAELPVRRRFRRPRSEVEGAEWSVFESYRAILRELNAEDEAGIAVWASRRLARSPRFWAESERVGPIVFLDVGEPTPARWRIIDRAAATSREVHVSLMYEAEHALGEVYLAAEAVCARLLESGFEGTAVPPADGRPAGLLQAERQLFRYQPSDCPGLSSTEGLSIRGAPLGDGAARLLASEVRALLDRGVAPEEILILFRHWSDEADEAVETLRAWGLPAVALVPGALPREPAVSALRLTISIPLKEWETELVVRLLRHGQICPAWPRVDRLTLSTAASTIQAMPVFRGHEKLLIELDRALARCETGAGIEAERISQARAIAVRLFEVLSPLDQSRPWSGQVAELRRVSDALGVAAGDAEVLDPLWDALDDRTDVLERLGGDGQSWSWAEFVAEVGAVLSETCVPRPAAAPGSIAVATVELADGAGARYIIAAGLSEGAFPARAAVEQLLDLAPGDEPDLATRQLFSREMMRFLKVLGSAQEGVILTYPTTDLKGQELLRAGFLEDLLALLPSESGHSSHIAYPRLHPALIDQPELAGSAALTRVRSTALASEQGDLAELLKLAADPAHRQVLEGTAAALHALSRRLRGTPFGEFDGRLRDGAAILDLDREFGPDFLYSPSQLETYLACPFQFFCKYVLNLKPIEKRDELDEDATAHGSQMHDVLESFETKLLGQPAAADLAQIAEIEIERVMQQDLAAASELDLGLMEIERGRIFRSLLQYVRQRQSYQRDGEPSFSTHALEVDFGADDSPHPWLEIQQNGRIIRLRGRIDRIDVAKTPEGLKFRVIDYKSGSVPSSTEVKHAEMLQLPLYAIAVERLLFAGATAGLFDLGYWSLRDEGYRPIAFESWESDQETLTAFVLDLVDEVRRGVFDVHSRKPGCENYCDYRGVCRLRQVRLASKKLERNLPELSVQSRRGRGGASARKPATGSERGSETDA
jgi:RecB family exonuclease